jgi:2-polyprenyl-3-methyl-5-hydroxy-6-metoxy-1,4-benzoquinol methylase
MLITEPYRELNAALHVSNPAYGTSGGKWAGKVHRLARQYEARSVLDYGCGRGTLRDTLLKIADGWPAIYLCAEYDPAIEGKDARPNRADLVVCGDVLEHIEPECLYAVLDDIRDLARKGVLLIVATVPASKTLADGRNTHLIVEPAEWWFPKLALRWRIKEFQDRNGYFVCVGEAR